MAKCIGATVFTQVISGKFEKLTMKKHQAVIVIHGGAGTVNPKNMTGRKADAYHTALTQAVLAGASQLRKGGSAVQAVVDAVVSLEDCDLFNAGRGSVLTHDGEVEMDAALMDGKTGQAGAVAAVRSVKNPVLLAKAVLKSSRHVMLSGRGALAFAHTKNLETVPTEYFLSPNRIRQLERAKLKDAIVLDHDGDSDEPGSKHFGTVGAVALDQRGNLAAATSTGGMTNKRFGRIGDSPIIGAGTFAANSTCAISCTGHGEFLLRAVAAHEVHALIKYAGLDLATACERVIHQTLGEQGGKGGIIAVDSQGRIALPFNTRGMYRGHWQEASGKVFTGIYE